MVSAFFIGMFEGVAVMFGLSPEATLYLFVLTFAVGLGVSLGMRFGNVWMGIIGFIGTLLMFSMLDAFPLWIIAVPMVIVAVITFYIRGDGA
jgi:hypothetical protein